MELNPRLALAGLLTLALGTTGCSLTGAAIGSHIDDMARDDLNLPLEVLDTLATDTEIELVLAGGNTVEVTYLGLTASAISDPQNTRILVQSEKAQRSVPYASVQAIRLGHAHSAQTIGTGIGAAVDIALLAWVVSSAFMQNWERSLDRASSKW